MRIAKINHGERYDFNNNLDVLNGYPIRVNGGIDATWRIKK